MEAGGDAESLDLTRLAEDPDGEVYDLIFEIVEEPSGFDVAIEDGVRIVGSAGLDTSRGSEETVDIEVTDPDGASITGSIELLATGSTEPLITANDDRSEEHTSELQSRGHLVCRLLLEKENETSKAKKEQHKAQTYRQ